MGSPKKKLLLGSIFGHFLLRNSAIQALSAVLIFCCMLPFLSRFVQQVQVTQGTSLSLATIAATQDALHKKRYISVKSYAQRLLKTQADIHFIVFSLHNGKEIIISKNLTTQSKGSLPYSTLKFDKNTPYHLSNNSDKTPNGFGITPTTHYVFSMPIQHKEQTLGTLSIAHRSSLFTTIIKEYALLLSTVLFATFSLGLFLFLYSSRQIRQQMHTFSHVATALTKGELTTRVPEQGIGELSILAKSINSITHNLNAQSNRLSQMAQIVAQTNDAFILFNHDFHLTFANSALQKITGYPIDSFTNNNLKSFANTLEIDLANLQQALVTMQINMANTISQDITLKRKDGHLIHAHCRLEQIYDEETEQQSYLLVLANISDRKAMERELHALAYYDKLTGLPNRRMFMDCLHKSIKQAERQSKPLALFFMDLDDFKNINDSMGHEAGDTLLVQVAKRLQEIFRESDLVTRLGGDEFTVIIDQSNTSDPIDLAMLADKAIHLLSTHPIVLNGRPLTIGTSLGISTYPEDGFDAETLVKNADTAMYAAKKSGKNNYAFYTESMNIELREYLSIETDLKEAIQSKDQLQLHYQPIVDLNNKHMVGVEVLARWLHPEKGLISPAQFIAVAEKTDLILSLSDRLLNQAFKQAKQWQQRGLKHYVSVNISVRQFEKPNFIQVLTALLLDYEIDPSKIQLEFTEGIMLDHSEATFDQFNEIKALGFKIAIDDFGTGYSSLSYIHKLPIDVIKIDQAFVADLLNNEKSQAILAAITQLSNKLNIQTVAEGIELNAHERLLIECQCQYGQGYLYDASMLLDQLENKYLPLFPEDLMVAANDA